MNTTELLEIVNDLFHSPIGFSLLWVGLVTLFFWLASHFNPFQEKWKQYEGSIITAIRLAEQAIPDDPTPGSVPNKGLAKLDAALKFVLQAYADANHGKQPSADLTEQLKQAIQIKHDELERRGSLTPGISP